MVHQARNQLIYNTLQIDRACPGLAAAHGHEAAGGSPMRAPELELP